MENFNLPPVSTMLGAAMDQANLINTDYPDPATARQQQYSSFQNNTVSEMPFVHAAPVAGCHCDRCQNRPVNMANYNFGLLYNTAVMYDPSMYSGAEHGSYTQIPYMYHALLNNGAEAYTYAQSQQAMYARGAALAQNHPTKTPAQNSGTAASMQPPLRRSTRSRRSVGPATRTVPAPSAGIGASGNDGVSPASQPVFTFPNAQKTNTYQGSYCYYYGLAGVNPFDPKASEPLVRTDTKKYNTVEELDKYLEPYVAKKSQIKKLEELLKMKNDVLKYKQEYVLAVEINIQQLKKDEIEDLHEVSEIESRLALLRHGKTKDVTASNLGRAWLVSRGEEE